MNGVVNKFLLAERFMIGMLLRQPGFTFTRNKERILKFKETGSSRYIYLNELDKVCFYYHKAYENFLRFS